MPSAKTTRRPPAAPAFKAPAADSVPERPFDAIPAPKRSEFIEIARIERDERVNTRPVDPVWVAKKAEEFSAAALGTPIVSVRRSGQVIVLDGQNRVALCRKVGWEGFRSDGRIECEVHEGLSLIEEAGLFVQLAGHRSLTAMSKFLARQTQKDPVVLDIVEIVERNGYHIGSLPAEDTITAVSTLEKIDRNDRRRHPGEKPSVLNTTLATMVHAWQYTPGGTDQSIIDGIGMLHLAYGDFIDQQLLIRVLAAYQGGPTMLKVNGSGARNTIGGTVGKGVAYTIAKAYDKEQPKHTKKLDFT